MRVRNRSCSKGVVFLSILVVAAWLAGCSGVFAPGVPVDPDSGDETFVVFQDPESTFSTIDVHDVDEEIVRFDDASKTLVWQADNLAFDGWPVEFDVDQSRYYLQGRFFEIQFGTKDGERRAYFTETLAATICNIGIESSQLTIRATDVPVPGS